MIQSPYHGQPASEWLTITEKLIAKFPLSKAELVTTAETAWAELYSSRIGSVYLQIGRDIFLPAQATGVILERLIATHLARHPQGLEERWNEGGEGYRLHRKSRILVRSQNIIEQSWCVWEQEHGT